VHSDDKKELSSPSFSRAATAKEGEDDSHHVELANVKLSVSLVSQLRGRGSLFLPCAEWPFATINCICYLFMLLSHLPEKLNVVYFTGGPNRPLVRNSMRKEIRR